MSSVVFTNAIILTMENELGVVEGDLAVQDGRIAYIGSHKEQWPSNFEIVESPDSIIIPGLINAHIHLWETGFRGIGMNWSGSEFHMHVQTDFLPHMSPRDTYLAEYIGSLGLIDSGTTGVLDWCHGNPTPDHTDAAIQALRDTGIRGIFAHGTAKTLPLPGEPHFSTIAHPRNEAVRLKRDFEEHSDKLRLALGLLGPDYSKIDIVREDFKLATELDLMTSAHVSGHAGKTPGGYRTVYDENLIHTPHNVVHANAMSLEEIHLLVEHGASITSTVRTELNGGASEPTIEKVLENGGRPSIGTDVETETPGDMLMAMRDSLIGVRLFRALKNRSEMSRKASTNLMKRGMKLPPRKSPSSLEALRWATIDNAKALGIDNEVGSLKVGKRADLAVIDRSNPQLSPGLNPIDAVVGFAHPGSVLHVMIDGIFVKRSGDLIPEFSYNKTLGELTESTLRILEQSCLTDLCNSWGELR